jgi:hypothetical protein
MVMSCYPGLVKYWIRSWSRRSLPERTRQVRRPRATSRSTIRPASGSQFGSQPGPPTYGTAGQRRWRTSPDPRKPNCCAVWVNHPIPGSTMRRLPRCWALAGRAGRPGIGRRPAGPGRGRRKRARRGSSNGPPGDLEQSGWWTVPRPPSASAAGGTCVEGVTGRRRSRPVRVQLAMLVAAGGAP